MRNQFRLTPVAMAMCFNLIGDNPSPRPHEATTQRRALPINLSETMARAVMSPVAMLRRPLHLARRSLDVVVNAMTYYNILSLRC
ncbi:MAG TPA: hypothetical protein VII56_02210 [Rhizomicrobium sp.]